METTYLKDGERAEDLQFKSLSIILRDDLPSFTTDAVLLSDFAKLKPTDKAADFGTGTGIIALLVYGRYSAHVTGFEIQPELCDMANRSFAMNGLSDILHAENTDFTRAYTKYNGTFSAVLCNPPYFDGEKSLVSADASRAATRSRTSTTLSDIALACSRVLKSGGRLFICYPAHELVDIFCVLRENKLEPKRLRLVKSTPQKPPYLALIEAKKDGGRRLDIEPELIITDKNGAETDEIKKIYHRE